MYLNLLENEQTVELFKQSPYSEKFQKEVITMLENFSVSS